MRFNKKIFVIVDAYTTGRFVAPLINANGYPCIHIQSSKEIISAFVPTFIEGNFIKNIIYDGDIRSVVECLSNFEVIAVIPGAETGVVLADLLGNSLGLHASNNLQLSHARRNKYEMVNCLVKHDIPHAKSFRSVHLEEILNWVEAHGKFPVVVKPLSSAGSDGVKICNNMSEVINAFNAIINVKDIFNKINTIVMVQEFLEGQEYIINTVSYDGKHKIVDIWRKFKNKVDGIPINDYAEIVMPSESDYVFLPTYIFKVLDALGIKFGAGHSEIMMTDNGPILIETAARLEGSIDPSAVHEATGDSHVACLVNSYLNRDKFLRQYSLSSAVKKYVRHTFLASPMTGVVTVVPDLQTIVNLPSFHSLVFRYERGDNLVKTTSLVDFPGFVYLVSEDRQQVEADYQIVREYEKKLYSEICQ